GIEYINGYLNKLYHENIFCGKFDIRDIERLMGNLAPNYKEAYLNIFEPVLVNSLGSAVLGKSAYRLGISYSDFAEMQKILGSCAGRQELDVLLLNAADRMLTELRLGTVFLRGYVKLVLPGISARLYYAFSHDGALREIYFPG
ncbi:MAG: DUF6179 domain-containing protein, partial [Bacillota bacterium]|nr:DUF6179 domain-containing protein [Bacillota bacterium]